MNFTEYLARLTSTDAQTALAARLSADNVNWEANTAYLRGDHWQEGNGWVGPPVPPDIASRDDVLKGVLRDFTSIPLIEEIVGRHVTGLVGREPAFELIDDATAEAREKAATRSQAKQVVPPAEVQQVNALLTEWFDSFDLKKLVDEYTADVAATRRAVVRMWVPREYLDDWDGTSPLRKTVQEALRLISVEVVSPTSAGILTHRRSMRRCGVAVLDQVEQQEDETGALEDVPLNMVEIQWVDDQGNTVVRLTSNTEGEESAEISFDADGALLLYEGVRRQGPLITEPVRRMQATIDMLASMLPRNAKYAGFRERHFFGVSWPKNKQTGEDEKLEMGAGVAKLWQNTLYEDENGRLRAMPASLVFGEPVDSGPIRADIQAFSLAMLRSTRQLHAAMGDDATASGVSRVQAMADFIDSLNETRPAVEGMLRWLIKTVLLLACQLCKDEAMAAQVKAMRASVDCKLPAGNLSPEEKTALAALVTEKLISHETAMTLIGIEDVDAELARIAEEKKLRDAGEGDPDSF